MQSWMTCRSTSTNDAIFSAFIRSRWDSSPLEVEVHVAPAGLGLQRVLIRHDELTQTLHHLREDIGGDETITQYFLSPLCPPSVHLFASAHCPVDTGYCLEAMVRTLCYGI